MKACNIMCGKFFSKSTHKKALKNVSTFNFPIFTFVSVVFCSCGKCPDMPTDIEKKCCLGKVAGRGLWRNRFSTTGEESLTF